MALVSARFYLKSSEDMGELGDGSVDLILTVPPEWGVTLYGLEYVISIPPKIVTECYRVLREGGFLIYNIGQRALPPASEADFETLMFTKVFYPYISGHNLMQISRFMPVADVVAIYTKDGALTGRIEQDEKLKESQLASCCEHFLVFAKGRWKLKRTIGNVVWMPISGFEMNEEVAAFFIELFSEEDDTVLDPFAGTGTTGKAALQLGRNAVLYDTDPEVVKHVREKIPDVQVIMKKEAFVA